MEDGRVKRLKPHNRNGFIGRFCSVVSECPEGIAFEGIEDRRRWTYGQLLDLMEQFRAAFVRLEIEKGDLIVVLLPSGPAFLASIYSLTSLSAISIPIDL